MQASIVFSEETSDWFGLGGDIMAVKKMPATTIEHICEQMAETINEKKNELFYICEQYHQEYEDLVKELKETTSLIQQTVNNENKCTDDLKLAKHRLYNYFPAAHSNRSQANDFLTQQVNKQLFQKKDKIERRLHFLLQKIEKTEEFMTRLTVMSYYLTREEGRLDQSHDYVREADGIELQIIEAQEEERKRLSRELHDGPAQLVANLLIHSDLVEKVYKKYGEKEAKRELNKLKKMIQSSLKDIRRMIYDLRPFEIDERGIVSSLEDYVETLRDYYQKTQIGFSFFGEASHLPSKYEVAVFRLVQEVVRNSLKHAEAKNINIILHIKDDRLFVTITDDGKGFDPQKEKQKDSFGIISIKERVELLNGEVTFNGQAGKGTVVTIFIPIKSSKKTNKWSQ